MKELIEVVFENIPQKSSSDLIFELFDISKGINVIYCSTTLCEINKFDSPIVISSHSNSSKGYRTCPLCENESNSMKFNAN